MTTSERELLEGVPTDLFVGGRWVPASGGGRFPVLDPATEPRPRARELTMK